MATNSSDTNLNVDGEDEEDELRFRDTFPDYSGAPLLNDEEHAKLLSDDEDREPEKVSFWEFKYYQKLFDVDTKQVIERMMWSVIPRPGGATYLHRLIRPNPDLYGPFWICATLIFTIAVSSNIAEYLQSLGTEKAIAYYDYRKVSFTATTLYSYTFLLPLAIWGFLWYFESTAQFTILEIICVYGYSLAIYIPISILWIVKLFWFQLGLIILGFLLSTSVMMLTFWPAVRETRRKISAVLLLVMCLFHALLCFGFSVYFFQPQHLEKPNASSSVAVPKGIVSLPPTVMPNVENKDSEQPKSGNMLFVKAKEDSINTINMPVATTTKNETLHNVSKGATTTSTLLHTEPLKKENHKRYVSSLTQG